MRGQVKNDTSFLSLKKYCVYGAFTEIKTVGKEVSFGVGEESDNLYSM